MNKSYYGHSTLLATAIWLYSMATELWEKLMRFGIYKDYYSEQINAVNVMRHLPESFRTIGFFWGNII